VFYPQMAPTGLLGREYAMGWPYKGPLVGAMGPEGPDTAYSRQQQEMMLQVGDPSSQHKRGTGQQGRQQGRLGRMASRIYSLRPRLRKADSAADRVSSTPPGGAAAAGAKSQPSVAVGMYTHLSTSLKNSLAALSASSDAAAAADGAATAASAPAAATHGSEEASAMPSAAAQQPQSAATGGGGQPGEAPDTATVLTSVGLPADTAVVGPQYYIGGPQGPAAKYSSLNPRYVLCPCSSAAGSW